MSEREEGVDTPDPGLIRLVSARYLQMQGLATIADAFFPLISGAAFLLLSEEWHALLFGAVLFAYLWSRFTWVRRRLDRYYATRYGRVGPVFRPNLAISFCIVISYGKILRDLFHAPVPLQMVLMIVGLCTYPLWIVIRDGRYRAYWLLVAVAGAASALQLPYYQAHDSIYVWSRNAQLAIGCALLAVGALDHRLLRRALHGGRNEAEPLAADLS